MNIVYICLRGKENYYDPILFCWGAISLAHANADDLVIPIQARPSGICSELIFCLPGHALTISRFSFDHYERYPLKNECIIVNQRQLATSYNSYVTDQMIWGILFLSRLSDVNFNICFNFWTVRDRDFHIWYAYSTNDVLSNDTKVTLTLTFMLKIVFFQLCGRRWHTRISHILFFPLTKQHDGIVLSCRLPLQCFGWFGPPYIRHAIHDHRTAEGGSW